MLRLVLAVLASALGCAAEAQPVGERSAVVGETIEWSSAGAGAPVRYRVGAVSLTLRTGKASDDPELSVTRLTVELPGHAPLLVEGAATNTETVHVAVGRWGDGRPYVLFQSFTGGAHCCNYVQLVLPQDGRLRAIDVGTWDGDYIEMPTDVDGDGQLDFVVRDNRFLYAFSSYAGSHAPPQIWNIIGGEVADVSAEPRYQPLFREAMAEDRAACLEGGAEANSPCAAYMAEAARVGEFDRAWREMLPAYERSPEFGFPRGCRAAVEYGACPESEAIEYPDFPSALRPFLEATGYLPPDR